MQALLRRIHRSAVPGLVALACLAAGAAAAAEAVIVTLVDGEATLLDGARRGTAAAGVKIAPATIVETAANAVVLRLEWPDRSIVDLGPGTRAMIQPPGFAPRDGHAPLVYLLQGWAKVTAPDKPPAGGVLTPASEVMPVAGTAVVAAGKPDAAFAESGALEVLERAANKRVPVPAGALYAGAGRVEPRPPADWLGRVPRAFRDPLPRRYATLKDRNVAASALPAPTYVMLADWLAAEPALRRDFPARFGALAQDPAFKRQLRAKLSVHPEWAPLFPPPPERKP